jgi:hypothetical protein
LRFSRQASRIWKGRLLCDLEDFVFLQCEIARTRQNSASVQTGVVRKNARANCNCRCLRCSYRTHPSPRGAEATLGPCASGPRSIVKWGGLLSGIGGIGGEDRASDHLAVLSRERRAPRAQADEDWRLRLENGRGRRPDGLDGDCFKIEMN